LAEQPARSDEPTDADLIARSIENPRSFVPLLERHRRVLYGYLARRVGPDLAEDLVAETFTTAFAHRERYDSSRPDARPWLFGIALNLLRTRARSDVRRLRAYQRAGEEVDHGIDADSVHAQADAEVASPELVAALNTLDRRDRDTLLLFVWGDLSYEEVAAALDVPVGTVRSRINRARRKLQTQLPHLAPANDDDLNDDMDGGAA
jgi:RNA polymerase sigma-70 factor (ECF subfamily)